MLFIFLDAGAVVNALLSPGLFMKVKGRPSLDDVERLSRGQAARKRGTGSRAVCHRLNESERKVCSFQQLRILGSRVFASREDSTQPVYPIKQNATRVGTKTTTVLYCTF